MLLTAAIVATGSELVRGDRSDTNGPYLARALVALGIDPVRLSIVGDDPAELERAIAEGLRHDLLVTSGGLGPTHDDLTLELVARSVGIDLVIDEALRAEIETRTRAVADGLRRPYAGFEAGVRKQALVPEGAVVVGITGTAPALLIPAGDCLVVALPGPPRELYPLWERACETEPLKTLLSHTEPRIHRSLRLHGVSESSVAMALEQAGPTEDVDVTICARDFEVHVDLYADAGVEDRAGEILDEMRSELAAHVYSVDDERGIAEIVLALCRERELTLSTAESCTGGMVAEQLTAVPGSSDVFTGAIVSYANEVKERELDVPAELIAEHGAVSAEVAAAMAAGVRARLETDLAVAVTGIAGPGGGSAEKPVGLVYVHASGPGGELATDFSFGGDRDTIRRRATATALHLVRRLMDKN